MTADTITSPATESRTGTPLIAVIGNPNTGKSTVFNALCGTRQRVANYPGVTVEKKLGYAHIEGQTVELLDLPGLYSLRADSPDEQVASDAVMGRVVRSPDAILFILDATNLKRNLYLFSQVRELDLPVVVALTMTDLLTRAEIKLNIEKLRDLLEVPVIPIVGRDAGQLKRLKHELSAVLADNTDAHTRHHLEGVVDLSPTLERCAGELKSQLAELYPVSRFEARELILDRHIALLHRLKDRPDVLDRIRTARERYEREGRIQYTDVATARYRWAELVISKCEVRAESRKETLTNKLDRFFTHRAAGLLAFVSIMYLMFQAIYSWAGPLMDVIEWSFGAVGDLIGVYLNDWPVLQSLLVDGVIGGVGSVVIFVPQIAILFLFIAVMEDSGYLARASFLMDRLLSWTGLNGRAFIPMLSSFACAVPGIMAARVMPDPRARMATILVAPLMSCSARLPVYVLLIGAFIEPQYGAGWAAFTLFAMHGVGLVFALPIAWILNRGVLRTPSISFVLEIPPYRMPRLY
ncbi:MAG: ferrous iron transport protein B, partial [Leptospiraceae bacterium]|nr:ferrous iron transport protein B [Leptospiraceae bacterium]